MATISLIISIIILAASLGLYLFQTPKSKAIKILFSLGIFISIIFFVAYGIINYITEAGITESAIYHLRHGIEYGLSQGGISQNLNLFFIAMISLLVCISLSSLLWIKKPSENKIKFRNVSLISPYVILLFLILSLSLNPVSHTIYDEFYSKNIEFNRPSNFYGHVTQIDSDVRNGSNIQFSQDSEFYDHYDIPEIKK